MDKPGQSALILAVLAGALLPLLHVWTGWIALHLGWRRGHLRDGLAHGMLLGPLGLLTALTLKPHRRATEALRIEYARISTDQYHVWFFTAWALLYVGIGTGYGMVMYKYLVLSITLPVPYAAGALSVLALGLGVFYWAKPPSAWIPPLADYNEYPEDPEYVSRQHFSHHHYVLRRNVRTAGPYSLLLSLVLAAALIISLPVLAEKADPQAWWVTALLAGAVMGFIAAQVLLYRRKQRAEIELQRFRMEHAADDPRWLPVVPLASRRRAWWLDAQIRKTSAGLRACRSRCNLCLFAAVGSVLGGIFVVASYPTWWGFSAVIAGVLPAAGLYWLNLYLAVPVAGLKQQLSSLQKEDRALADELHVLTTNYVQEQRYIEFAFGHEEVPHSLLARRIILRGRAPEGGPAESEAESEEDDEEDREDDEEVEEDKEGTYGEDEEEADEEGEFPAELAGAAEAAGDVAPDLPAAPAIPVTPRVAEATQWGTMQQTPHPRRVALQRSADQYFSLGLRLLLILRLAGVLALPVAAVLCLIGGWQKLRAQMLPETIFVPHPESARLAPRAFIGALLAPAAPGTAMRAPGQRPPDPAVQQQQDPLLREVLALDDRLVGRSMDLICLLWASLGLAAWLVGSYLVSGNPPSGGVMAAAAIWLALATPLIVWLWRGNTALYWRRIQLQVARQPTELWRHAEAGKGYFWAWQDSARHRLRLLWVACGLLYGALVLGLYWIAGLLHGPHPVPAAHWALICLGLAGAAGCMGYAYARARAQMLSWRGRWLARIKMVQHQQYKEVMVLRSQAEVLEEHDGFEVQYCPQELDDATIARWVELDFRGPFRRDPVEHWLDRLRSIALAGVWCILVLGLPLPQQPGYKTMTGWALILALALLAVSLLCQRSRLSRQRALRG